MSEEATVAVPMPGLVSASGEKLKSVDDQLIDDGEAPSQLPEPTGYRLLIALPQPKEMTDGGIIKASETMNQEEIGTIVGFVMKLGPDAYNDEKRFPNGPYCKERDFVMFRAFSGTRFKVHGQEFRLINDDSVEAVVDDPRGIIKV